MSQNTTTATQFESVMPKVEATGNGLMLIISAGKILTKNATGKYDEEPLPTGEENALVGIYLGNEPNKFDAAKLDQKIRLLDGTLVILRETANLRRGFANVNEGDTVRVVYGGKRKMKGAKNAGKSVHDFDVQRAINVAG